MLENTMLLKRFCYAPMGTFGTLRYGDLKLYTVEKPWVNNERNISCIPEGSYEVKGRKYNKGDYYTYEIVGVPNRTLILVHVANLPEEVEGCVGIGSGLGAVRNRWAVTGSQRGFNRLTRAWEESIPEHIIISFKDMKHE